MNMHIRITSADISGIYHHFETFVPACMTLRKLNLVIIPHRALCLDHMNQLRESATVEPVPMHKITASTSQMFNSDMKRIRNVIG